MIPLDPIFRLSDRKTKSYRSSAWKNGASLLSQYQNVKTNFDRQSAGYDTLPVATTTEMQKEEMKYFPPTLHSYVDRKDNKVTFLWRMLTFEALYRWKCMGKDI